LLETGFINNYGRLPASEVADEPAGTRYLHVERRNAAPSVSPARTAFNLRNVLDRARIPAGLVSWVSEAREAEQISTSISSQMGADGIFA
jgi:hypothetical protein